MTREELHARVWSEPMQSIAKWMGISDVALAKRCRKLNVPVPPRGWWAKKAAGKAVAIRPLPLETFVLRNYFPALEPSTQNAEDPENPPRPIFRDLTIVKGEIDAAVDKLPSLKSPPLSHPIIARLLQQDEGRKKDERAKWASSYWGAKFASPIQQRRLGFLSGLFLQLERLGCKISGSTHSGEDFSIQVKSCWCYISCFVGTTSIYRSGRAPESRREYLRLDITEYNAHRDKPKKSWVENGAKLERQLSSILQDFLFYMEQESRVRSVQSYEWTIENKARQRRDAELAAQKAELDRIAQEQAAKEARIRALVEGADAAETAARIRRYVVAVRERFGATRPNDVERWAQWALANADEVDPLVSGAILTQLNEL